MIPNANSKEDGIPCSTMVIENLFKNIEKQCQISEESQLLILFVVSPQCFPMNGCDCSFDHQSA